MLLVSLILSAVSFEFFFSNVTVEERKTKEKNYELQSFHNNNCEKKNLWKKAKPSNLTQSRNRCMVLFPPHDLEEIKLLLHLQRRRLSSCGFFLNFLL